MRKIKLLLIKIFKIGILTAIFGIAAFGFYKAGEVKVISVSATETDSLPTKIEQLKDEVVEKLASCESAGHKEEDAIIILDTNKKMSIGVLQFQVATVQHYYKSIYGKVLTKLEATLVALDANKASELAKDIIFKTDSGVISDWYNCSKKLGLQQRVDIIKELSN